MFETIINRILNRNPHYLTYLSEIAGLVIAIEVTDLPIKLTLLVHHSFIEVKPGIHEAALRLQGSSVHFILFATQKEQRQKLLQKEQIKFAGDLMLLQKLERFLNHFHIPELLMAPIVQSKHFARNQVEYWQEEKQLLASPILFDYFKDEILDLQQEMARLAARLQVLEAYESSMQ